MHGVLGVKLIMTSYCRVSGAVDVILGHSVGTRADCCVSAGNTIRGIHLHSYALCLCVWMYMYVQYYKH